MRLNDLRAGQLDIIERLGPTDVAAVKSDAHLRLVTTPTVAYRALTINVANGPASKNPLGQDARVRAAFEKSIDRGIINQVVMNGLFVPNNQTELPNSRYWDAAQPVPARDVEGAKALLREAGQPHPSVTLTVENSPSETQAGQVIQSMAAEAGFDVRIQALEPNTLVAANNRGDYQMALVLWSGRADPDFNISIFLACDGFQNWGKYCNPQFDSLLNQARSVDRCRAAPGALQAGGRALHRRQAGHLPLQPHRPVRAQRQARGVHRGTGRADPPAGDEVPLIARFIRSSPGSRSPSACSAPSVSVR